MATHRHRSSASPLALVWAGLVVYASLYPFEGWRWPPGQGLGALSKLPWTHWNYLFDVWINGVGYLPLGALLTIAVRRSGFGVAAALLLAIVGPAVLSYSMEVMQHFVPGRVPAMEDFVMNSAGAVAGALLALLLDAAGLLNRWQTLRERWFARESAGALALMTLWPVGLLFPTPLPLGLGQVAERLREALADLLDNVPWAQGLHTLLVMPAAPATPLRPLTEILIVALGLLSPCLVAYSVMRPGLRRVAMAAGALLLGVAGMTVSTLLNFGPRHAFGWVGPAALPGLAAGLMLALAAAPLPRRVVAGVGLVTLTGLVLGVAQAPSDPYFAQSLQAWEQGRFVRFHGLAQWVGWLWPFVAMGWLLLRLSRADHPPRS